MSEVLVGVGLIATAVGSIIYQAYLAKKCSPESRNKKGRHTENSHGQKYRTLICLIH